MLLCLVATGSAIWIASFIFTRLPVFNSNLQFKVFDSKSLHKPDHFGNLLKFLGQALFTMVAFDSPYHCEFPADFYASPVPLFKGYLSEPLTFLCSGGTVSTSKQQTLVLTELTMSALSVAGLVRRRTLMAM